MEHGWDCIIVQVMKRSRHVFGRYRAALQRYPVGQISLEDVYTKRQLEKLWRTEVKMYGRFSLLAKDSRRNRIVECVGVIRVEPNGIEILDRRSPLYRRFAKYQAKQERIMGLR